MTYVDEVYEIVKRETKNWDAIYNDYIIELVGVFGMQALVENKLVESCGVVGGRQLYVLVEKPKEG